MRIGIDARFYGSVGKGLGRYTQKLIENLEIIDQENRYFIFLRKENFKEYQPKNKNFQKILADYHWYTFSEQINMPRILKRYDLDIVHFPHFNVPLLFRKKFIITIHDLILLNFPTIRGTTLNPLFYWLKFLAYKIVIRSAIKRAKKIIAVSQFTKYDIFKNYRVPEEKIAVTYEACDSRSSVANPDGKQAPRDYGIMKPYILYVGNAYPHKNLEALVLAFKKLNKEEKNLQLVLVGKEDYFYRRLKDFVRKREINNVVFAGFVPDNGLDIVYRNAELYIFPSLYEGFGLPPLEAMARGVPVVSSDHPCMKEVLGNSAYYFDAREPDNIARAIKTLFSSQSLREELMKKGSEQIKKYSWKKMAEETLQIYQSVKIKMQNDNVKFKNF
ncbi:MAG: glycosyltransferase family 1 protein [Candidatus Moranbacteria bacterium]|nr:glycosyltransferase family 1 protein [Candidatus Moranbacteria bacterium]